jgi:hypothetical protein
LLPGQLDPALARMREGLATLRAMLMREQEKR